MIAAMGRAECLSAVALVVGARMDPVKGLRSLVAQDPALARLGQVADRCASGMTLAAALRAGGLIRARDAEVLAGLPPDTLAAALQRLAYAHAQTYPDENWSRWFPVWVILAATVPSLAIAAVVAAVSGTLYGGLWQTLGFTLPVLESARGWFTQAAVVCAAVLIAAVGWTLLRELPRWLAFLPLQLRTLTRFSPRLAKAEATIDLLHALRAGRDPGRRFALWRRYSGDRKGVRQMAAACGGDAAATLVGLGVVPCTADGRADWDVALGEWEGHRARAAAALVPILVGLVAVAGLYGFLCWYTDPFSLLKAMWHALETAEQFDNPRENAPLALAPAVELAVLLGLSAVLTIVAHHLHMFAGVLRWLGGPASDWPLVADRVARALDAREDLDRVLAGLRLAVARPMRRRLATALAHPDPHPGRRLAAAGVVPRAQATIVANADPADLPTLLRSAGAVPDDAPQRGLVSQAVVLLTLASLLTNLQEYLLQTILPKFHTMFDSLHQDFAAITTLSHWALRLVGITSAVLAVAILLATIAGRLGWGLAAGGWARLARGLVLRRLLAARSDETTIAQAIADLAPRRRARLAAAAHQGDLPGVLAAAGWPVDSPAALDRALADDCARRDRRRLRLTLLARLLLPVLVAVPVGLASSASWLAIVDLERTVASAGGSLQRPAGGAGGGTPAMVLLHWATLRYERQGEDAIVMSREIRADLAPGPTRPAPPRRAHPIRGQPSVLSRP